MKDKINTEIIKGGKGFDKVDNTKYDTSINQFFNNLRKLENGDTTILKSNDVYVHLLLNHDFDGSLSFKNIQTGKVKGTVKDLYEGILKDDFFGIVVQPKVLRILELHNEEKQPFVTDFNKYLQEVLPIRTFSMESVRNVWSLQKSKESIIWGIMQTPKKNSKNDANLLRIVPDKDKDFNLPSLDYHISGSNFPVMVQEAPEEISVKKVTNSNNDKADVIVDEKGKIIDMLKLGDFWLYDYPLINRQDFFGRFEERKPYLICYTVNEIYEACELLKIDKSKGILIRSVLESVVPDKCNWYILSPKSLVTFKNSRSMRNAPRVLQLADKSDVFEFDIDLDRIEYDFIEITLDGTEYHQGLEENWWMDKEDFDVWSRILSIRKRGRKKKMENF